VPISVVNILVSADENHTAMSPSQSDNEGGGLAAVVNKPTQQQLAGNGHLFVTMATASRGV